MKQEKPSQVPSKSGALSSVPVAGSLRDLVETWELLKDVTHELTIREELGWPEWRRWF